MNPTPDYVALLENEVQELVAKLSTVRVALRELSELGCETWSDRTEVSLDRVNQIATRALEGSA